jgi:hypothetical protein
LKQVQKFHLTSVAPLLMHNGQLSDPLNQWSQAIKKITDKRKKTLADLEEVGRLEWYGGLYLSGGRRVIPREATKATLLRAGKNLKKGPQVKAGLVVLDHATLEYDGPTAPDELWQEKRFVHRTTKALAGKRVVRTRPIFEEWRAEIVIAFNDEVFNPAEVEEIVIIAGSAIGFLEERPEFGRFHPCKL